MYKLTILTSHPIQYQAPLFRALAKSEKIDPTIYFRSKKGAEGPFYDKGFEQRVQWDVPLLKGYKYEFVENLSWLLRKFVREKPDVIILYGWNSFTNWLVAWFALRHKIPFFIYGENTLSLELLKKGFLQPFRRRALRFLLRKSAGCFYVGQENKKFYEYFGVPEEKLFSTPYSVDNERFISKSKELRVKRKSIRKKLNIPETAVVILFVGKFIPKKRPLDLLKAYTQLTVNTQKLTISLLYVGGGILLKSLRKHVEENNLNNVYFVGFKNQTELPAYYVASDFLVLPSGTGETWGLVVNEAMCFGLPVIVSDLVGCGPDLVYKEKNGYVFRVGDIDTLAGYITELVRNTSLRKGFGRESFRMIKNYNYERDVRGILEAIENV